MSWRFSRASRLFFWVWGLFALCACSRHWEIIFMPCVLVAAGVAVLYAAWRMGRS